MVRSHLQRTCQNEHVNELPLFIKPFFLECRDQAIAGTQNVLATFRFPPVQRWSRSVKDHSLRHDLLYILVLCWTVSPQDTCLIPSATSTSAALLQSTHFSSLEKSDSSCRLSKYPPIIISLSCGIHHCSARQSPTSLTLVLSSGCSLCSRHSWCSRKSCCRCSSWNPLYTQGSRNSWHPPYA
jgi:hypothetical protein